jgi:hypothetical protein
MRKISWILFILASLLLICCRNSQIKTLDNGSGDRNVDSIFVEPEKYPNFKGGEAALTKFIGSHLNQSIVADTNLKEGRVIISFLVDTIGEIGDFKIERSYNQNIDSEFLRVLRLMPNWEPGKICLNNMKGPWENTSFRFILPLKIPYK